MKRILLFLLTFWMGLITLPQLAEAGRMYDPEISRFMSIDPILNKKAPNELQKLAGGQVYSNSPYNYTFNNPINLVDPDGHFPITPWDVLDIGFAVASVVEAVNNPTLANIGFAAYDVLAAAAPIVPSSRPLRLLGPAGDAGGKITKQIPDSWSMKTTKKGDGTIFKDPENPSGNNVRAMSGNPGSPNPSQQKPYVKQVSDGKVVDKSGNEVPNNSPEAHIPTDEFKFKKE